MRRGPGGGFLSHPPRTVSIMRLFTKDNRPDSSIDPFTDPVAYLAELGIEAELIEVVTDLHEAA